MNKVKSWNAALLPVLFGFFIMGFVDVVNLSTSYVKADFSLNDKTANLLPMMVFFWFAVCSLPVGKLMNKIGRKSTVLISAAVTIVAMVLPLISYTFPVVLAAFALLGIGNTILQVSLNPLLTDVVSGDRTTSMLTLGQFIKAISSTLGPVIISAAVGLFGNWKMVFPIYATLTAASLLWLALTPVKETAQVAQGDGKQVRKLLSDPYIIMLFFAILLSVGFEIGLMTTVPKYMTEKFGISLEDAGLGCSLYYIARTIGTFLGSILLVRFRPESFLKVTVAAGVAALVIFSLGNNQAVLLVCLFLVGLFCANIFAIVFSAAMNAHRDMSNDVSALMIMGVAGGALIPPLLGIVSDAMGQWASLVALVVVLAGILAISFLIKKDTLKK